MYLFSQPLQLVSLIIILISLIMLLVAHHLMLLKSEKIAKRLIYTLDDIPEIEPCEDSDKKVSNEYC